MKERRVYAAWNWYPINRPYVTLCDPVEGTIWIGLSWGNGNSDPVWTFSVRLGGLVARPLIALAGYRWDKAYAKQEARKARISVKEWKARQA